jgi:hypothetical protein
VAHAQFHSPFKFYRNQPRTLYLSARVAPVGDGELIAHATLRSLTELPSPNGGNGNSPQEKVHFTADVRLTRERIEPVAETFTPPAIEAMPIAGEDIYRIYFHGPAYKVLERVQVNGDWAIGLMPASLPPNTMPEQAASLMAPRLIEACFQTAGVWAIRTKGVMALPTAIESVKVYRQPHEANGVRLFAIVQPLDGGGQFDARVVDEAGNVYVELAGYRTVQLPGRVTL